MDNNCSSEHSGVTSRIDENYEYNVNDSLAQARKITALKGHLTRKTTILKDAMRKNEDLIIIRKLQEDVQEAAENVADNISIFAAMLYKANNIDLAQKKESQVDDVMARLDCLNDEVEAYDKDSVFQLLIINIKVQ